MSTGRHVLLIEQDLRLRPMFLKMLLGAGFTVSVVGDWSSGIVRANEEAFDLVIAGFHGDLGDASNVAMFSRLRTKHQQPVLVLSSARDCRMLKNQQLAPGIRAIPRLSMLDEVRRAFVRTASITRAAAQAQTDRAGTPGTPGTGRLQARTPATAPATAKATQAPSSSDGIRLLPAAAPRSTQDTLTLAAGDAVQDGSLSTLLPDQTLRPGTVIDKYRIEALVGCGGFAHVYRAKHLVMSMPCAVKVLKRSLAEAQPHVVDDFCTEARNAIRISHPNVVRIYDVTRGGPITYLVMEWIDGVSLLDVLRSTGPLPANDVLRIGIEVCAGLEAALALGMIHRDVKPANILLTNQGPLKLVDFGLAMHLRLRSDMAQTGSETMVGTPAYMSPEQAVSPGQVDSRSDMYSLGATLFHACAGHTPFQGEDAFQLLLAHRDQPAPNLCQLVDDCPPEFAGLVARMLAKDREQRFSSLAKVRKLMQELLDGMAAEGTDRTNGWSSMYMRNKAAPTPPR